MKKFYKLWTTSHVEITEGTIRGICAAALILLVCCSCIVFGQEQVQMQKPGYGMKILNDTGSFTFYVNEETLVKSRCEWREDGSFKSEYTISMAGQIVSTSMEIAVDEKGDWKGISMTSPQGQVQVVREDTLAKITKLGKTSTVIVKPGTILFENFSPLIMTHAVWAYDQKTGGKQSFPLFIIPSIVMTATLERLETIDKNVMGRFQKFTQYRYGLPGVDVTLWVDDQNHLVFGDVPAQHGAYVRDGYEALMLKPVSDALLSQPRYEVRVESNVGVPMRDNLKLATDIYLPEAPGKFPVILVRTPYKKEMNELQAKYYARRGYVYAVQDCRGRFASPGKWEPFFNEPGDGYDTVEWLAKQEWSNGKVGMIGGSYLGWVQWWAGRERPPHLVTIIPNVSPPDPYYNIPYEYGAFFLFGAIWWADVLEQEATGDLSGKAFSKINQKKYVKLLRHLPVVDLDKIVLGSKNRYFRDWIKHPDNDDYWEKVNFLGHLKELDIPVFHQSGWFDGDGIGSKLNYLAMKSHGHENQKLVLGPWGHTTQAQRIGPNEEDFGPEAIIDLETAYTRWLDRWLLGIDNGIDREPLVTLFVMGSNKWLEGNTYPLPETQFIKYYLGSRGNASTSQGDGFLGSEMTSPYQKDEFVYDPADPTPEPTYYFDPEDLIEGSEADSQKVKSVEESREKALAYYSKINSERRDILVYDTPTLLAPLTICGPVSAVLYAASSARDTDWFMRLSKIDEKGGVFPLTHGVIRARYRESFSKPTLLEPGKIYEYHLDLWQTGITFPKGSKIRVEVASASFPLFSRNLNTGGHNETEKKFVSAHQTIYHDPEHPSHVLLPVIPSPDFK